LHPFPTTKHFSLALIKIDYKIVTLLTPHKNNKGKRKKNAFKNDAINSQNYDMKNKRHTKQKTTKEKSHYQLRHLIIFIGA